MGCDDRSLSLYRLSSICSWSRRLPAESTQSCFSTVTHSQPWFGAIPNFAQHWFVLVRCVAGIGTIVFDVRLVFVDVGVGVRCLVRFAFVSKLLNNGDGDVGIFWPCNVAHPWKLSVECGDVKYSCHALSPNANVSPPWLYVSAWQWFQPHPAGMYGTKCPGYLTGVLVSRHHTAALHPEDVRYRMARKFDTLNSRINRYPQQRTRLKNRTHRLPPYLCFQFLDHNTLLFTPRAPNIGLKLVLR